MEAKIDYILDQAFFIEDILKSKDSKNKIIISTFWIQREGNFGENIDKILWYWHVKIKNKLNIAIAILLSIISFLIFLGEISIFTKFEINIFSFMIENTDSFVY